MTKRAAYRQSKADWNIAISEGRVARFESTGQHKSYLTAEAAEHAVQTANEMGLTANIVPRELADPAYLPKR